MLGNLLGTVAKIMPFTGIGILANIFKSQSDMRTQMKSMQSEINKLKSENENIKSDIHNSTHVLSHLHSRWNA